MKKVYILDELDCANCALKMESAVSKLEGVLSVKVNFLSKRMTIEADEVNHAEIRKLASKIVKRIEPDCELEDMI